MIVTWVSKQGGRPINEDAVGKSYKRGIFCIVVADGLGGHNGGQIASDLAVTTILDTFNSNPGFSQTHIKEYILSANKAISERAKTDPDLLHMSSTVAVLLQKGRYAIWANVGDTRVYRLSDGMISDVSEDHSLAFIDFVNGTIEYDGIRTSPNQNKLTNALGIAMDGINISPKVHISSFDHFVLCTDGWWEYVTEDDIERTLNDTKNPERWLKAMLEIREAKAPDDSDNYTAAVVSV